MSEDVEILMSLIKQTSPEKIYAASLVSNAPNQKRLLKSLYDLALQLRQDDVINQPDFVR